MSPSVTSPINEPAASTTEVAPSPFFRHHKQRFFGCLIDRDNRVVLAAVHNIFYRKQESSSKRASRMEYSKILRREVTGRQQCYRNRIPHRQGCRRAGSRSQPERGRLAFNPNVDSRFRHFVPARTSASAHRNDRRSDAFDNRQGY